MLRQLIFTHKKSKEKTIVLTFSNSSLILNMVQSYKHWCWSIKLDRGCYHAEVIIMQPLKDPTENLCPNMQHLKNPTVIFVFCFCFFVQTSCSIWNISQNSFVQTSCSIWKIPQRVCVQTCSIWKIPQWFLFFVFVFLSKHHVAFEISHRILLSKHHAAFERSHREFVSKHAAFEKSHSDFLFVQTSCSIWKIPQRLFVQTSCSIWKIPQRVCVQICSIWKISQWLFCPNIMQHLKDPTESLCPNMLHLKDLTVTFLSKHHAAFERSHTEFVSKCHATYERFQRDFSAQTSCSIWKISPWFFLFFCPNIMQHLKAHSDFFFVQTSCSIWKIPRWICVQVVSSIVTWADHMYKSGKHTVPSLYGTAAGSAVWHCRSLRH